MLVQPPKTKVIFYKGEDRLLECQLVDDTGTPINLGTLVNIIVWVYSFTDETVLAKFSWNAMPDHDSVHFNIINVAQGRFNCLLMDTVTDLAVEDFYWIEIKTVRLADDFEKVYKGILCKYCNAETTLL
jgi:hypothetical protein